LAVDLVAFVVALAAAASAADSGASRCGYLRDAEQKMRFAGNVMPHLSRCRESLVVFAGLLLLITSFTSCRKPQKTVSQMPAQRTFASPEEAGAALFDAARSGDQVALLAIFGPDSMDVFSSGDPVKDKDALQDFVAAYAQMHRWREINAGGEMLCVGADNVVFPVPLGRRLSGQWYFDTGAGKDEILARRIGQNELAAIAACGAVVNAEDEYFKQTHDGDRVRQYAQRFVSDEGKENGLYWPVSAGQAPSPLGDVHDFAVAAGYTSAGAKPQPFDGYYFRILTRQGEQAKGGAKDYIVDGRMTRGFAVLAYPAEYRSSGIMTFLVGPDGIVYQKDLGEKTADAAEAVTEYDPSNGWTPAL
jgi:Protein of unknown function (DUF2950)